MVDNVCQNALLPLIVGVPAPFLLELALTLALLLTTRWRPLPERLKALKALKSLKALKAWSCILLSFELHHSTYSITKSIYFIWLPAIPCFSSMYIYIYICEMVLTGAGQNMKRISTLAVSNRTMLQVALSLLSSWVKILARSSSTDADSSFSAAYTITQDHVQHQKVPGKLASVLRRVWELKRG